MDGGASPLFSLLLTETLIQQQLCRLTFLSSGPPTRTLEQAAKFIMPPPLLLLLPSDDVRGTAESNG